MSANSDSESRKERYPQDRLSSVRMTDPFARETAKRANLNANVARAEARKALEMAQKSQGTSRCRLCGEPATGDYCHEHVWAAA